MADRYLCCSSCPKRDTARLLRAFGEVAAAEEVLEAGCPDWWGTEKGFIGPPTAEHPQGEPLVGCGRDLMPKLLASVQRSEEGHAQASEEGRNAVLRLVVAGSPQELDLAVRRYLGAETRRLLGEAAAPRLVGPGTGGGDQP